MDNDYSSRGFGVEQNCSGSGGSENWKNGLRGTMKCHGPAQRRNHMTHQRLWTALACMIGGLLLAPAAVQAATYQVDPVHSTGVFSVHHFGAGYVWGLIGRPTGTFDYSANDPAQLAFSVKAPLANLTTENAMRDRDLKGPNWFNVAKFPTIDFKSASAKKIGDDTYQVTGDLTIHGVTKSVSITMKMTGSGKDPQGNFRRGFETTFTVNRNDYGLTADAGLVGDEVRITVALEGIRQP
jgi:polyisoprenoid-binding protein YceI